MKVGIALKKGVQSAVTTTASTLLAVHPDSIYSRNMNKTLQVRDVPEATHNKLRSRAGASGKSLSQYVLELLNRSASTPTVEEVLDQASKRPINVSEPSVVDAIRSRRDLE